METQIVREYIYGFKGINGWWWNCGTRELIPDTMNISMTNNERHEKKNAFKGI